MQEPKLEGMKEKEMENLKTNEENETKI